MWVTTVVSVCGASHVCCISRCIRAVKPRSRTRQRKTQVVAIISTTSSLTTNNNEQVCTHEIARTTHQIAKPHEAAAPPLPELKGVGARGRAPPREDRSSRYYYYLSLVLLLLLSLLLLLLLLLLVITCYGLVITFSANITLLFLLKQAGLAFALDTHVSFSIAAFPLYVCLSIWLCICAKFEQVPSTELA